MSNLDNWDGAYKSDDYYRQIISNTRDAAVTESRFLTRTYVNLTGAVLLFAALEALIFTFFGAEPILRAVAQSGRGLGIVMLALCFLGPMGVNAIISNAKTRFGYYVALVAYVVLYTVLFIPILSIASSFCGTAIIWQAVGLTAALFVALSAAVIMTRANFTFLRAGLAFGGIAALILIVASLLFGFELGAWFSIAMILLACGYILFETSVILHANDLDENSDVVAALTLFGSVMTLFFYILRLLLAFNRR